LSIKPISALGISLTVLFSSLFLSGCSQEPYLTTNGSYEILSVSSSGTTEVEPIELPWDTNMAIMKKFLMETSFVLSDLHTPSEAELSNQNTGATTSLLANFSEAKRMTFWVDNHNLTLDVQTLQIVVDGGNIGQVTINKTIVLQGINDPNLQTDFEALNNMLHS
jgi:hypothetical protein